MKSKLLPPLRNLEKREREREKEEEMELKQTLASTDEDKNDYYFKECSNICK